jgi:predicted dehydrogenase
LPHGESMDPIKVLVVGSGVAGAGKHIPFFQKNPGVVVVGVCDPDLARARRVAAERGLPGAYASLADGLRETGARIVSICTPPQTHRDLAILAMEHGADVLVEKPFTITLAEAREVVAAQKRTGRKLSVVHQNKFTWGIMQMEQIVRRGEAGRVLHLGMTWLTNGDSDRMVIDPNFWCHKIPGGRWAESLPHQLYIAYALVGEMRLLSVAARKTTDKWPWMSADEVDVVLESRDGYVNIRMSANPDEAKRRINILHGTHATFMFSYKTAMPLAERPRVRSAGELIRRGLASRFSSKQPAADPPSPHEEVIRRFVDHVLHDAPPPTSPEEALHVEELTEEFGSLYEAIFRAPAAR